MNKLSNWLLIGLFFCSITICLFGGGSDIYPWPAYKSWNDLASWAQPLIASGDELPPIASAFEGDLFILATSTVSLYRMGSTSWVLMSGGGNGGVATHSDLTNLDYDNSGHTGFASITTVIDHINNTFDPHGSSPTFSGGMTLGSGVADASIARVASGTIRIASYTIIIPETATPTDSLATGTLWYDANLNKLRCYDGTDWHNLW